MTASPMLQGFIGQARNQAEPNSVLRHVFGYEVAMLERLVSAIDTQTDVQLSATVSQMKAELDALGFHVYTILPTLVNVLAAELKIFPRFEHYRVEGITERVSSYCTLCGVFIAASHKPQILRVAEKAHKCPGKNKW